MGARDFAAALGAGLLFAAPMLAAGAAATQADAGSADYSDLEEVTVMAPLLNGVSLGGDTVTQQKMQLLDRDTLDRAILLASGTSVSLVGARNETDVWIRGFDRWRVPLYQDGIPVYLPVDNRIDFSRFTTIDIAQVQISKGYASVIDGPGAMGGSINLVSRVVTQPFEAEARYGASFDSNAAYNGSIADVFVGTRQASWYLQAAGSFDDQSHFRLSNDFVPGTLQGSGDRIQSFHEDYKVNLKAGYDPSPNAEYSVNYIDQIGRKDNPPPDGIIPAAELKTVKYWIWPAWDVQSFYWLSKNVFDADGSFVKTRLYYDRFFNKLDSYDTISYSTQDLPKSFDSTYDDLAAGGSVEVDENLAGGADTLRAAGHFRWDQHNETEDTRNAPGAPWYQQPWETADENTWSLALENIYRPAQNWQVTVGGSYDVRHLIGDREWVAQGSTAPYGYAYSYPVSDKNALNGEFELSYSYSATGAVHLSYADRARFPTLFEMYSTRFGTFQNNPDLGPERSHYAQAGIADQIAGTHVVFNVFLARVSDAIEAVPLSPVLSEDENVGTERQEGFEVELSRQLASSLLASVDYSYLKRVELTSGVVPTDTPADRIFAYLDWRVVSKFHIVPSVDMEGRRWLQNALNDLVYYRTGSYTLVSLKGSYWPTERIELEIGASNVFGRDYLIEDGYNGPGREYFVNVRAHL
jgi:iron complex outermembrane recepter protein